MQSPSAARPCAPFRPPHPMTALRRLTHGGTCQQCAVETNYVCSACSTPAYYCSPRHLIDVRVVVCPIHVPLTRSDFRTGTYTPWSVTHSASSPPRKPVATASMLPPSPPARTRSPSATTVFRRTTYPREWQPSPTVSHVLCTLIL